MKEKLRFIKNGNFVILFSGQMVSTFGNYLYLIALPWYILNSTNSRFALALVGFAQTLPMIGGLFSGVFVDRWNKKWTMILSDIIRAFIALLIGISVLFFSDGSTGLFIFVVISVLFLELTGTLFFPAQMSLIPKIVEKNDLTAANGLNQSGRAFAQLIGSISGGALLSFLGAATLFLFNSASFFLSVISLFFIRVVENRPSTEEKHSFFSMWKEGMAIIWNRKLILRTVISSILGNFVLASLSIILAAWVKGALHAESWVFGVMTGAELGGVLLGGIVVGAINRYLRLRMVLLSCALLNGISLGMLGLFPNVIWDITMMFLVGCGIGIFNSAVSTMLMHIVPEEVRGRVFATGSALTRLAAPIGIALFGFLILHFNLGIVFGICALFVIASGLLYIGGFSSNIEQSFSEKV